MEEMNITLLNKNRLKIIMIIAGPISAGINFSPSPADTAYGFDFQCNFMLLNVKNTL
jgi:hypothetical protein